MTDYIEELDRLPSPAPKPKGRPGRRSHYIRTLIEEFIGSDATIWKVVKTTTVSHSRRASSA